MAIKTNGRVRRPAADRAEAANRILEMLDQRERDAHARLTQMQAKIASGGIKDDNALSEIAIHGLSEAWAEAKNASELAWRIARGENL